MFVQLLGAEIQTKSITFPLRIFCSQQRMAATNAVASRSLVKCPTSLNFRLFCVFLSVIYATKMTVPANIAQLDSNTPSLSYLVISM